MARAAFGFRICFHTWPRAPMIWQSSAPARPMPSCIPPRSINSLQAASSRDDAACKELILRGGMHEGIGLAGADDCQIIGARGHVWKQIRNPKAALAMLRKGSLGA